MEQHRTRHKLPQVSGWAPRKWRAAVEGTAGCHAWIVLAEQSRSHTHTLHPTDEPGSCSQSKSQVVTGCVCAAKLHRAREQAWLLAIRAAQWLEVSSHIWAVLRCADFLPSGNTGMQMTPSVRAHQALLLLSCSHPGCSLQFLIPCSCSTVPGVPARKTSPS